MHGASGWPASGWPVNGRAPAVLGVPVLVPPAGEYVADGAARQAAWVLSGTPGPPQWPAPGTQIHEAELVPHVRQPYADVRDLTAHRVG